MIPERKKTNQMSSTNAPAFLRKALWGLTHKEGELKQSIVVLLRLRYTGIQEGDCNLRNRIPKRDVQKQMYRNRALEICIKVNLSVCLNTKMHMHKVGLHKARERTTTGRTILRERTTGDLRLEQHFHRAERQLSSNQLLSKP